MGDLQLRNSHTGKRRAAYHSYFIKNIATYIGNRRSYCVITTNIKVYGKSLGEQELDKFYTIIYKDTRPASFLLGRTLSHWARL